MCMLMLCTGLEAQHPAADDYDDPRRFTYLSEPLPLSDGWLFDVPLDDGADVFRRAAAYDFMAVRYSRRGYDPAYSRLQVAGIDLSDAIARRPAYTLATALRRTPGAWNYRPVAILSPGALFAPAGLETLTIDPLQPAGGGRVGLSASDRTARWGINGAYTAQTGDWGFSAALSRRWGRDGHIDGLFMDEATASLAAARIVGKGSVTLFAIVPLSERSSRQASTREAFELTGENLYNPAWGWCGGEQRASRVRRNVTPLFVLTYQGEVSPRSSIEASLGCITGREYYSGLNWWREQNPLPDYHRNLPSWSGSEQLAAMWRSGDPRVTQIDWEELAAHNAMSGGESSVIVADDARAVSCLQTSVQVTSHPWRRLETSYGFSLRSDTDRYYSRVRDLLGGSWIEDLDRFLIDDERYQGQAANDMRRPGRRVREGGEYGYNYRMHRRQSDLRGSVRWGEGPLRLEGGIEAGSVKMWREGLYEKQTFRRGASLGASREVNVPTWTVRIGGGWTLSPEHLLDVTLTMAAQAPAADDVFLSPRSNNLLADRREAERTASAQVLYRLTWPDLQLSACAYLTSMNGPQVMHYYDDRAGEYCDLALRGVARRYCGVEVAGVYNFSPRLSVLPAVAFAPARYASNPATDLYTDADGVALYKGQRSFLKGCRTGLSPEMIASAGLRYTSGGWRTTMTLSYMDCNYLVPDPTRRTSRMAGAASSPEARRAMLSQEKLPAATTLNAFLSRTFYLHTGSLIAGLSVSNLLGDRNIISYGYEQMRARPSGVGAGRTYTPYAPKYLYSYGRTWYASLNYYFR